MSNALNRRDFIASTGGAAVAAALPLPLGTFPAPGIRLPGIAKPVAISSANSLAPVTKAAELVIQGADTLDAAVEGADLLPFANGRPKPYLNRSIFIAKRW